jgi:nicotinamidase-related amidase
MTDARMLAVESALVAMIDIQENHYPHVLDGDGVLDRTTRFIRASRTLEVPVVWTEHYPKAFGPTLPPLRDALSGLEPISKTSFGCFGEPRFVSAVESSERKVLYLVGSETHICIQQTALGALEHGLDVVLLADCVTARSQVDHEVALERLTAAGVTLTTWEAVVYEWMRASGHPCFKQVLPLVKGG